jgi:hypothetical protein
MPAGDAGRGAPARADKSGVDSLASVERLLLAHHVRPDEPLAVRLLGTVGPNGSWALDAVEVQRTPGRIVLVPRVRRVPGDFFIQMVIPLDHTVSLDLPAGRHRVEVRCREGTLGDSVSVALQASRAQPQVRFERGEPVETGTEIVVPVRLRAEVADGFVDRVEIRSVSGRMESPWQAPEAVERDGPALAGSQSIRRPSGDPERRVEARAIDGQGQVSATATLVLPAR